MTPVPSSLSGLSWRVHTVDLFVALLAPAFAMIAREPGYFFRTDAEPMLQYSAVGAVVSLVCLQQLGISRILARYLSGEDVWRLVKASAAIAALTAAVSFSLMRLETLPRALPFLHFLMLTAGFVGARWVRSEQFRRLDQPSEDVLEKVLIVGASRLAWLYVRMLNCIPGHRQKVVAILDDNPRVWSRSLSGIRVLGGLDKLEAVLTEYATHGVFIQKILIAQDDVDALSRTRARLSALCAGRGIQLEVLADRFLVSGAGSCLEDANIAPSSEPLPTSVYLAARRAVERVIASALLVVSSPALAVVAVCVLIDVGAPIVFWQERVGRFGRPISVHKFRTLCASVDKSGKAVPESRRLSPIGAALRATRLDELPQLFDIARGAMSMIGPRPLLPVDMPEDYFIRQQVPPGITGWAQVNGGKLIAAEEKNALDEWYIAHASPWLDLQIIGRTVRTVLTGDRRDERAINEALRFRSARLGIHPDPQHVRTHVDTQPLNIRHQSA